MFFRFRKPVRVADLAEGRESIVEGKVVSKTELTMIGSGKKCVYYDMLLESFGSGPRGAGRALWMPVRAETKTNGFFVDDGTGKVWVAADPESFDVSGARKEGGFLNKLGNQRYQASLIEPGDTVRVLGAVDKPGRKEPNEGLVLRCTAKGKIKILVRK